MHKLFILLLTIGLLQITGCATALVSVAPTTTTEAPASKLILEDKIVAVIPYTETTELTNPQSEHPLLILYGMKNTYLLRSGANELIDISRYFDGKNIAINHDNPIVLHLKNKRIYGTIRVSYQKNESEITPSEMEILDRLKFQRGHSADISITQKAEYWREIYLRGEIYLPDSNISENESIRLRKGRTIQVYQRGEPITKTDPHKIADKFLFSLPMAIIFDAVTLPLQAIFFVNQQLLMYPGSK